MIPSRNTSIESAICGRFERGPNRTIRLRKRRHDPARSRYVVANAGFPAWTHRTALTAVATKWHLWTDCEATPACQPITFAESSTRDSQAMLRGEALQAGLPDCSLFAAATFQHIESAEKVRVGRPPGWRVRRSSSTRILLALLEGSRKQVGEWECIIGPRTLKTL